ncbi:MAG TPA: DNA polymerase III subunit delta' [Herpetosiphonaceae bacterium]
MATQDTNWGIVGHEWAVEYLRRSLLNGRGAHAYLFAGPDSIGKALLAQRLAQALVCETGGPDACLTCRGCRRAAKGNHPDVRGISLAMQAASDKADAARSKVLRIETIREWQRDIDLRPFEASRRVFVLDDAQALNEAASNAMLKTLEEPPPYAVLILIAQGAGDLLPTIVSRCRVLRLRPLSREAVARALQERYNVAAEDAALVAAWSAGRIGWAFRAVEHPDILEQQQQRLDLLIQLGAGSRVARMRWAEERAKEYRGGEHTTAIEWLRLWQSWWRDVLLLRSGNPGAITHLDRRAELEAVGHGLSLAQVQHFLTLLDAARQQLAENVNPQLAFENVTLHIPDPKESIRAAR